MNGKDEPFPELPPGTHFDPPHDGETCAGLRYDARLQAWVYPTTYSDKRQANRQAITMCHYLFGAFFFVCYIDQDGARRYPHAPPTPDSLPAQFHHQKDGLAAQLSGYATGWYATLLDDPRPRYLGRQIKNRQKKAYEAQQHDAQGHATQRHDAQGHATQLGLDTDLDDGRLR